MSIRTTIAAAILVPAMAVAANAVAEAPGSASPPPRALSVLVAAIGYLTAKEKEAIAFRYLQTELMVAALSCGRKEYRAKYNTFVIRYRPALRRNGRALRAIFKRSYGSAGKRQLDDYITRLANEASVRSMQRGEFCVLAGNKLNAVLTASSSATQRGLLRRAQNH